jgi:hypothetical protein
MHLLRITVWRLGATLAAGMVALPGCGFVPPNTKVNISVPTAAAPTSSTSPQLPRRPFEMPLNNTDPCGILGTEQRARLGFDLGPLPNSDTAFGDVSTCSFRDTRAKVGARLGLITSEGMTVWTGDTAQVAATPILIAGFPALVIRTPQLNLACDVEVDVADGQHLDVLYRDDGAQPPAPLDQLCAGARRVAELSVATLARKKTSSARPTTSAERTG